MQTNSKLTEDIPEKYIDWIRNISIWDPIEMRHFIAENIKTVLDKFSGDLLFLAQKEKNTRSKDILTRNTVLEIIKEIANYLPPMEMN